MTDDSIWTAFTHLKNTYHLYTTYTPENPVVLFSSSSKWVGLNGCNTALLLPLPWYMHILLMRVACKYDLKNGDDRIKEVTL